MKCKNTALKVTVNADGTLTIKGKITAPDKGYHVSFVQTRETEVSVVMFSSPQRRHVRTCVPTKHDVTLTIADVGQSAITVTTFRNGNAADTERLFVSR